VTRLNAVRPRRATQSKTPTHQGDFATGRFTKKEVLAEITRLGLRTRRGLKVSPQAFDVMLENRLYIGILDVPDYGVHGRRGDFEPLIDEELFYRVQGVLN
jgi:Recombinase